MYCHGCGVNAPDDANYCVSCGADLRELYEDETTLDDLPVMTAADDAAPDETREVARVDATESIASQSEASRSGELRNCPACGAANSPRRYLCGRCGADLETGEAADIGARPVPSPASAARTRHAATTDDLEGRGPDRRWRAASLIVLAGLLVGGLLGAMVVFGIGPFSGESSEAEGPVFDREAYPDQPSRLVVSAVAASTARDEDEGFNADRLVDGDLTTAWNSRGDVNPEGIGEVVEIEFEAPVWVSHLIVANGDQADDGSFVANARVRKLRAELDGGSVFAATLLDQPGEQAVRLPIPRFTTTVRLEVLEVYLGDTYDDLALSEVEFRGYVANEEDAEMAGSDDSG